MKDALSLNHTKWECKYHIIWIPKYRKKALFGQLRQYLGQIFRELAHGRESKIIEGHLMADHVHMLISIPPKYSVAQIVGYIKGKSAIHIARNYMGQKSYGRYGIAPGVCSGMCEMFCRKCLCRRVQIRQPGVFRVHAARMTDEDRRFLADQKIISPRFCPLDFD